MVICGVKGSHEALGSGTDGSRKQASFLFLLIDIITVATKGRQRIELVELQRDLLLRGWHP